MRSNEFCSLQLADNGDLVYEAVIFFGILMKNCINLKMSSPSGVILKKSLVTKSLKFTFSTHLYIGESGIN